MQNIGFLFDLDGVIVDTAKYHFLAWKELAQELSIPFTEKDNERLKGVSRMRSFEIILSLGKRTMSQAEKEACCAKKNEIYLSYINRLRPEEVLPGTREFLSASRAAGIGVALGSASRNAPRILERLALTELFDAIIDGTTVLSAKPDPEVFLKGAGALGLPAKHCVVFEDSVAGIQAAHAGGMRAVGVGRRENLPEADICIPGFVNLTPTEILKMLG